jgi:polyisoprenoid-binding protein YceI
MKRPRPVLRAPLLAALFGVLASVLSAAERTLILDPVQSRVEIVVKATVDSFTGKLAHPHAVVTLAADGTVNGARLAFKFRDILTGKEKRDRAMHEWQQSDNFPDGDFVLATLAAVSPGQFEARGRLSFHGVTRELTFPVTIATDQAVYAIDGEAVVDTREFSLPIIRMMGLLKVDPLVRIRFHLQGRAP